MSWHFLQGGAAASWEASSLDGAPDALSKLMPMPGASCWQGSETDSFLHSQSGITSRHSTGSLGEGRSKSSAEDFRASISALPKQTPKESTATAADCGSTWPASFARLCRNTSSWKTHQPLLCGGWESFCGTWPNWGMMRDGECWELATPDFRTNVTASGLWPTPRVSVYKSRRFYKRKRYFGNLEELASHPDYGHLNGKCINPEWMEWIMGWVIGWAEPKSLETANVQAWLRSHGVCSEGHIQEAA